MRSTGDAPDGDAVWRVEQAVSAVASRMWSPAHISARWSGGDLEVSWIRRARKGGDAWIPGEPPHEVAEAYRVRVSESGIMRQWDVATAAAAYLAVDQATDFPAGGVAVI